MLGELRGKLHEGVGLLAVCALIDLKGIKIHIAGAQLRLAAGLLVREPAEFFGVRWKDVRVPGLEVMVLPDHQAKHDDQENVEHDR
jgi:hypothetical protein